MTFVKSLLNFRYLAVFPPCFLVEMDNFKEYQSIKSPEVIHPKLNSINRKTPPIRMAGTQEIGMRDSIANLPEANWIASYSNDAVR